MPSLRHTRSTVAVRGARVAPYTTANHRGNARINGPVHDRAPAPEHNGRRVLGELDWWIVTVGQRDFDEEFSDDIEESDETPQDIDTPASPSPGDAGDATLVDDEEGSEAGSTADHDEVALEEPLSPAAPFIELSLSIAPVTPMHQRYMSASPLSSVESTPETWRFPTPCFTGRDLGFQDPGSPPLMWDEPERPDENPKIVPDSRALFFDDPWLLSSSSEDPLACAPLPCPPCRVASPSPVIHNHALTDDYVY